MRGTLLLGMLGLSLVAAGTGEAASLAITQPQDGATVSGTTTITAEVSTEPKEFAAVTHLLFFADSDFIGYVSGGTSPYQISWNANTVSPGPHTLVATMQYWCVVPAGYGMTSLSLCKATSGPIRVSVEPAPRQGKRRK